MFSNHREIMLILIFTSKLPREGGELFSLKKTSPSLCQSPLMGNTCRRYGSLQGALRSCCPGRGSACPGRGSPVLGKALPVLGEVLLPWDRLCLLASSSSATLTPHHCSARSSASSSSSSNKSAAGREGRFFTYTGKSQGCRNITTFCGITGFWNIILLC